MNIRGDPLSSSYIHSYPTRLGHQILKNFSLTLPPCKTVAIVGESGGGNFWVNDSDDNIVACKHCDCVPIPF